MCSLLQLQDVFNLLPDVLLSDFIKSMNITTNDQMLVVYLASLIRSSIALHNLIDNKITNRYVVRVRWEGVWGAGLYSYHSSPSLSG